MSLTNDEVMDNFEENNNQNVGVNYESPEAINTAIDNISIVIREIFLENDFIKESLKQLRSLNYNKLQDKERMIIMSNINDIVSQIFGENVIKPSLAITEKAIEGDQIGIYDGQVCIYEEVFKHKNSGLTILSMYINELTEYLAKEIVTNALSIIGYEDYKELKGKAKIYYENVATSPFCNSWNNFKEKEEPNYYNQPIIYDAVKLQMEILFEHLKYLYQDNSNIDAEMSELLYKCIHFNGTLVEDKELRKKIIEENHRNLDKYEEERSLLIEYLDKTEGDLSNLNDDEFYELFSNTYYSILSHDEDGKLDVRLTNMVNELMKREFRDFDTSKVDMPIYKLKFDIKDEVMSFSKIVGEEVNTMEVSDPVEIFVQVMTDISLISQIYDFFEFNSEEEKEDYFIMKEWIKLKNKDFSDPCDEEVFKDGLNIVVQKITERLANLQKKVEKGIAQTGFIKGKSMLRYESKDAYFDFHEFKNGYTRKEYSDALIEYARLDAEDIKKRNIGGRK